jgi:hypothetical protein
MQILRLFTGLLLVVVTSGSWAGDKGTKPSTLKEDLEKLQGEWQQVKPEKKGDVIRLSFAKDTLALTAIYGLSGAFEMDPVQIELKDKDKKRVIRPTAPEGVDGVSAITYRFEGDKLIIEDGTCGLSKVRSLKGEWKHLKKDKEPEKKPSQGTVRG